MVSPSTGSTRSQRWAIVQPPTPRRQLVTQWYAPCVRSASECPGNRIAAYETPCTDGQQHPRYERIVTGPMTRFRGEGASRGIAIGPAHVVAAKITVAERRILRRDRAAEVAHLEEGISAADEQLDHLQRQLADRKGAGADLVQAHRMMLRSPEVAGEARRLILEECFAAEWAVTRALDEIRATFVRIQDPVFSRARRRLRGRRRAPDPHAARSARAARRRRDAPPARSPWAPIWRRSIRSTSRPRASSGSSRNTAARRPTRRSSRALSSCRTSWASSSSPVACFRARSSSSTARAATSSSIPPTEALQTYRARAAAAASARHAAPRREGSPRADDRRRRDSPDANVESLLGVASVTASGAEGIGLFRTEFLYLERPDLPTEDEQYRDALSVLNAVGGLPVTFRTLDLGGDKLPSAFRMPEGPNPALASARSGSPSRDRTSSARSSARSIARQRRARCASCCRW